MGVLDKLNQIKSCKEDIKQAIIDKGVDMTGVSLEGYATKISEIQTGGGSGDYLDMRANMSTYYSTSEKVGFAAFGWCYSLQSVNLPMCSSVGNSAFYNCSSLQSVNLPMCEYVGSSVFTYCKSLQSVNLPICGSVGVEAFASCSSLQSIDLPICSSVGNSAFASCSSLQSIDLPNCSSVGYNTFAYCYSLQSVNLPICGYISNSAFYICSSLQSVNLPICGNISDTVFYNCKSLSVLDLRSTYSCSLPNSNAFTRTPFASGIGSIYVHNTVLSQFQNATNWTYFSNCFVGVGDATKPLLSFDSGRVYGDTTVLYSRWTSYLGVASSSVISIDLPNVKNISKSAGFSNFYNLTNVSMNNLVSTPEYMCRSCSSLQSVNLPMCEYVGSSAFQYCSSLTSIDLPNCRSIDSYAFQNCKSLQTIYLPKCSFIAYDGIAMVENIKAIYIGTDISTVCKLTDDNGFLMMYKPSIFVPMSLVDAYKSAQYWSNNASLIFGI